MVDRKINGPLMIPVSEKYKDMGAIAVGKIESGRLHKNDSLLLMPNHTHVEVNAIYNEMEDELQAAQCGDNVRIRLRGVEDEDISPGFVLTSLDNPVRAVKQFEAQLAILDHKNIICAGYSAVMHVHTLAEEVTLAVRTATYTLSLRKFHKASFVFRLLLVTLTKRRDDGLKNLRNLLKKARRSLHFWRLRHLYVSRNLQTMRSWDGLPFEMRARPLPSERFVFPH